uniref:DH domain-containing protein n=1 Tax=Timema bartmani TaxID=61472 RepID=A0A7R9I0T2_9NEOP|nr:unnamed protein product [Timema bartmani]
MRAVQLGSKTWSTRNYILHAPAHFDYSCDSLERLEISSWRLPILENERSQQLGDDKNLSEHLKLPIQRINDYQLLLKWELVRQPTPPGKLPDHSKLSILTCLLSTDVNKKLEADFLFGFERLGNCCV